MDSSSTTARPGSISTSHASSVLLCLAAGVLALEPARWLFHSWRDQGYDGIGWVAFVLVAGLFAWSASSPLRPGARTDTSRTFLLLAASAGLRLTGQLLDVNILGALLLAVDVYALARLAQLPARARAVSPFWLAALFCFSLPVEPMLQRLLGYPLQLLSAELACPMLGLVYGDLACDGTRLRIDEVDVLVDLPCSGAELLSLVGLIFTLLNSLSRPRAGAAALGALAALGSALIGNAARITLLAIGIAEGDRLPFDVMAPTPHTIVGLTVLALVSTMLLTVSKRLPTAADAPPRRHDQVKASAAARDGTGRLLFAFAFLAFALLVGAIQPQPVDASPLVSSPPGIPRFAAGFFAEEEPLSALESLYFERYGGSARRASFGPFGLLLVSTASPLRHLHDPTLCLRGMGFGVRLRGTDHDSGSTVYVAERPDNEDAARYTVRVSYRSDRGHSASSIGEVVWRWLSEPDSRWTMVQRITPEHAFVSADAARRFEAAMRRAYNLS